MQRPATNVTPPLELRDAWLAMQDAERPPRQRNAAAELGVSEAQLVAAQCGDRATRLAPRWLEIVKALEPIGTVMALTRNEYVVIEKDGVYRNVGGFGPMAQVVDAGIDLRLFLSHWSFGFALTEEGRRGTKRSLQFFDASGTAVHKVFLREHSDVAAYDDVVARFAAAEQPRELTVEPLPVPPTAADHEVDVDALRADWRAMKDTHEFFHILRKHQVRRVQALRLAGRELAREVAPGSVRRILDAAAASGLEIMVFAGSRGCIEIHTGPVRRIVATSGWLNVLDPGFNLHAREEGLASAWVVHKPSDHGVISSLEVFSPAGENVLLLFANRKAGDETVKAWQERLGELV